MPNRPCPRRVAAASFLGALAALAFALGGATVDAFFPTNGRTGGGVLGHSHERITTDALEALDGTLLGAAAPTASMRAANETIVDGNIHVDDDQLHSALHFDGENFVEGQARLLGLKEIVIASVQQNDAQAAREELGQALHSIQDFYAHSNWTNNNGGVNPDLGVDGHALLNTLGPTDPAEVNGVLTAGLTSGYYHGEDRVPPTLPSGHKDRHGGPFDSLSSQDFGAGLNRDSNSTAFSPQSALHETAASLASAATAKYVQEVADQLTPQQVGLLLGKGPTLGLVIDTTNSMGPIIAAVRDAATQLVNDRLGTADEPSQYVLGQINDPVTPPPVVTSNPDEFKSAIAALTTSPPGVDCPELAMAGMESALGPMDPGGELFVWTDASAKDSALAGSVSALAQSKNVHVNFVLFGSCSPIDPGYIRIANETGGQLFFLTTAEVDAAAGLPRLLVGASSAAVVSVRDVVASGSKDYAVPVDSAMTEVTFSADTSSMQVRRPTGELVQPGDADATILDLSGGRVVKIASPLVGSWTVTIGTSPAFRLEVFGTSGLDLARFRFIQAGGRDGHDGLFAIPGLPLAAGAATADAVLTGAFGTAGFELRRPDGTQLQDLSLASLGGELPGEFQGTVTVPSEPFVAYATGQDGGGHPFQRVSPQLIQPETVSIAVPPRQDLHRGATTTYVFSVTNAGATDTFDLTAMDDKGFITSATPSQVMIPSGGSTTLTVVVGPPPNAALGTSDALTVRAASTGTPGLENFASLTSVVVEIAVPSTTTTTTTLPCVTPRCTIEAALHGAECGDETVPGSVTKKLERALGLIDRAASHAKTARRLRGQARRVLHAAARAAGKAAKRRKPKLTRACADAIARAVAAVTGAL